MGMTKKRAITVALGAALAMSLAAGAVVAGENSGPPNGVISVTLDPVDPEMAPPQSFEFQHALPVVGPDFLELVRREGFRQALEQKRAEWKASGMSHDEIKIARRILKEQILNPETPDLLEILSSMQGAPDDE